MRTPLRDTLPTDLKSPFVWFGGKSYVADLVWRRFGKVENYVEPFFGSGAVLLRRPDPHGREVINDLSCYVANFFRAVQQAPEEVARYADQPVTEADLSARHLWLVTKWDRMRVQTDPLYYSAMAAGWWCWGINCWIGSGWCSGKGPWITDWRGRWVKTKRSNGKGVVRQLPYTRNQGLSASENVEEWLEGLSARLRHVYVTSGNWDRVLGETVLFGNTRVTGRVAIFLDPPYDQECGRYKTLYDQETAVSRSVREWCLRNGPDPRMRIALCGYDGEHRMPATWEEVAWTTNGGMGNAAVGQGRSNRGRERIWFSPACHR